jgi:hypothetical protein
MGVFLEQLKRVNNKYIPIEVYLYDEEEWIETHPGERYATFNVIYNTPPWYWHNYKGLVTEDNYILEIWDLKYYGNGRLLSLSSGFGYTKVRSSMQFWSYDIPFGQKSILKEEGTNLRPVEFKFVKNMIKTLDIAESYFSASKAKNLTVKKAYILGMKLLNKKRVRDRLKEEVTEAAKANGMSVEWLMKQWKIKVEEGSEKASIEALKALTDIMELKEEKAKTSFNFKIPLSSGDIEALESSRTKSLGDGNLVEYEDVTDES